MARYLGAKFYQGEQYYLQIDSHSEFVKDWDAKLIKMMEVGHLTLFIAHTYLSQRLPIAPHPLMTYSLVTHFLTFRILFLNTLSLRMLLLANPSSLRTLPTGDLPLFLSVLCIVYPTNLLYILHIHHPSSLRILPTGDLPLFLYIGLPTFV